MAVARNIGDACASVKLGKWERSRLVGVEVKGKSLAIIGLGKGTTSSIYAFVDLTGLIDTTSQSALPLLAWQLVLG